MLRRLLLIVALAALALALIGLLLTAWTFRESRLDPAVRHASVALPDRHTPSFSGGGPAELVEG
jgi:hypothetical protein